MGNLFQEIFKTTRKKIPEQLGERCSQTNFEQRIELETFEAYSKVS